MARMNTTALPKFRRLASELKLPDPYVLGHLEMLWQYAHQTRQSLFCARDIELIVHWQGAEGEFLNAAIKHEWLDSSVVGMVEIHDYENNAPEFVKTAIRMKEYRKRKQEDRQSEKERRVTERYVTERNSDVTVRNANELLRIEREREREREREEELKQVHVCFSPPIQEPEPDEPQQGHAEPPSKPIRKRAAKPDVTSTPKYSEAFEAAWKAYPHRGSRSSKAESYERWRSMRLEAVDGIPAKITGWIEYLKSQPDWTKNSGEFVPGFQVWLSKRVWTNGEPPAVAHKELACEWETE